MLVRGPQVYIRARELQNQINLLHSRSVSSQIYFEK